MANLVKFTLYNEMPVFINIDAVNAVYKQSNGTFIICVMDSEFTVKETREEVMRLLGIEEATE